MDSLPSRYSRPSFLSLPRPIRQRIYLQAGLRANGRINLNYQFKGARYKCQYHSTNPYDSTHSLLLVCRLIYAEVSALVYSTNRFFIRYRDAKSLNALTNLTKTSLASLTQLAIHLNAVSCDSNGYSGSCCSANKRIGFMCNCSKHDKPLDFSSRANNAVLAEWQNAAGYITANIKPHTLKLSFVCDVVNLATGKLAVQPLRSMLLAECSIRLSRFHHPLLQDLAVEIASQSKGPRFPPKDNSPFRLLDLPPECRLRILEYTDLVTPLREVEWNPKDNFYLHYTSPSCAGDEGFPDDCPPRGHSACQFRNCWRIDPAGDGCFCMRYHTAFSSKCRCWIPPTPLFLVCRVLRQEAQIVFFEKNHFVISPAGGCILPVENSPEHLEALTFFEEVIPSTALRFLKSLEIVFPPFHEDYLELHEAAYRQWLQVIDLMCQLNLPKLSLAVVMGDGSWNRSADTRQFRGTMSEQQAKKVFDMYSRTLEPMSKLKHNGLRAFFLTLASPYTWVADILLINSMARNMQAAYEPAEAYRQQIDREISEFTQRMERAVMGQDYDSSTIQERWHGQSQWLEAKAFYEDSF